jgi:5'-phosphate synthase pdxT subunit
MSRTKPVVGVLALQGAFSAHADILVALGVDVVEVRRPRDLDAVDALVMPGGESTTMSQLLESSGLFVAIRDRIEKQMPVMGTCAGLILMARTVLDGRSDQHSFAALDITVRRNAYGRQIDSFEADIPIDGLGTPFTAVFIRAPQIEEVGPGVRVIARHEGTPVVVATDRIVGMAFHPELTGDPRLHQMFVEMISHSPVR